MAEDSNQIMRTADFDFILPAELVAQVPATRRDESRLLVLHRKNGCIEHRSFRDIREFLKPGDVLVLNDSRVIPARLRGANLRTGGQFEMLLLEEKDVNDWWVMLRPGKRARIGTQIVLRDLDGQPSEITATVVDRNEEGHARLKFTGVTNISNELDLMGEMPVPPYIERAGADHAALDKQRYQTVFARTKGSVAAPTAGLHFTEDLLAALRDAGIEVCFVTLHVGLGTFAPVKAETLAGHRMHSERYVICAGTAENINCAKRSGRRIVAVGTTTLRVLESAFGRHTGQLEAGAGTTRLFVHPPHQFVITDALLTNFHLPRSTLLMLVSAFASPGSREGRELVLRAYAEAIKHRYRFYSYGDAMLLV